MNPELQRNLWLELTPRRVALMAAILGLVFFASALPGGLSYGPSTVASFLYYVIVVFWGTRNAALSVVGEIRDRTWDAQRLSSLGAAEMTWGKLFGATSYNWLGGLICLAVIVAGSIAHSGPAYAAIELVYYLVLGVIAQASAFLASLIAVRRRQGHSRLELMLYQLAGLAAAFAVYTVWSAADPTASLMPQMHPVSHVNWWGIAFETRGFLLVSLAIFAAWILVACYREMRLELQWRNGPLVWIGFLAFIGVYCAGLDTWASGTHFVGRTDQAALRLLLVFFVYAAATYVMVLLEPKDRVQLRWLGAQLESGRVGSMLWNLQAWMMSYIAAFAAAAVLLVWLAHEGSEPAGLAMLVSATAFLTRDVAIFVACQSFAGRSRGDFAAVVVLVALYGLVPAILGALHLDAALVFFYPRVSAPTWLSPGIAWAEAILVAAAAVLRLSVGSRQQMEAAA